MFAGIKLQLSGDVHSGMCVQFTECIEVTSFQLYCGGYCCVEFVRGGVWLVIGMWRHVIMVWSFIGSQEAYVSPFSFCCCCCPLIKHDCDKLLLHTSKLILMDERCVNYEMPSCVGCFSIWWRHSLDCWVHVYEWGRGEGGVYVVSEYKGVTEEERQLRLLLLCMLVMKWLAYSSHPFTHVILTSNDCTWLGFVSTSNNSIIHVAYMLGLIYM